MGKNDVGCCCHTMRMPPCSYCESRFTLLTPGEILIYEKHGEQAVLDYREAKELDDEDIGNRPASTEDLRRLRNLLTPIAEETSDAHWMWCKDEDCTIRNPKCPKMRLVASIRLLGQSIETASNSLQMDRTIHGPAEAIYLEEWKRENTRPRGGRNTKNYLLEAILRPTGEDRAQVSARDKEVAACVVQWLGTGCGRSFLETCERKIRESRAVREKWKIDWIFSPPTREARDAVDALLGEITRPLRLVSDTADRAIRDKFAKAVEGVVDQIILRRMDLKTALAELHQAK